VFIGDDEAHAAQVLGAVWVSIQGISGKYNIYGSYSDFTIIYFAEGEAEFIYSSDSAHISASDISQLTDGNDSNRVYAYCVGDAWRDNQNATEQLVFRMTNMFRAQHGLTAYNWNDKLAAAARLHSQDMQDRDYFSHYSPEGFNPGHRIAAQGYNWSVCAENIIYAYYATAFDFVDAWINSSGHRANMLGTYKDIGVGWSSNGCFGTQDFATSR